MDNQHVNESILSEKILEDHEGKPNRPYDIFSREWKILDSEC